MSTIEIFPQRQDGQVSNEDPGNEGRRILRGGPAGLNLSNLYIVQLAHCTSDGRFLNWVVLTMTLSGDGEVLCDPGQTNGL